MEFFPTFEVIATIFIDCVIRILANKINIDLQFSKSSILVIDTASVVANRLRIELFPSCPITNNATVPHTKGRGLSKEKNRVILSNEIPKEDKEDPISQSLHDTLQRRPDEQIYPKLSINKTHQRKTAFGVMNRATKNKFRQIFFQWKAVLEQATIGRSIEEPTYCEAIYQLDTIVEQIIQKSNSSQ